MHRRESAEASLLTDVTVACDAMVALTFTRSVSADCTARVKDTSFLLRVGAFRAKFYGNGVIPCQNVDTVR